MVRIVTDLFLHCYSAFLFAALVYVKTHSPVYAGVSTLGSVFIDLDHLLDHYLYFKNKFKLSDFLRCFSLKSGKMYLFLHSWELNFILLMIVLAVKLYGLWIILLGMCIHLAIDNLQRRNLFAYFLVYRAYKKFDAKILLPEYKEVLDVRE